MIKVYEHKNIKLFYLTLLKNKHASIVVRSCTKSFTFDVFNTLRKKHEISFKFDYLTARFSINVRNLITHELSTKEFVMYLAIPFEYFIKIYFNKGRHYLNRLTDLNLFLFSKFMDTRRKLPELLNMMDEFSYMVD